MSGFVRTVFGIVAYLVTVVPAFAGETFVVTGDSITSSISPSHTVKVGERLPITELKKRFGGYTIQSTAGEDCAICASVYKSDVGFEVNYDETGVVVTSVVCNQGCSDALGNEVGAKLQSAIGAMGNCDAGDYTTCVSPRVSGLIYIVNDDSSQCQFNVSGQATKIPECAEIGGFMIQSSAPSAAPTVEQRSSNNSVQLPTPPSKTRAAAHSFSEFPAQRSFRGNTRLPDFAGRDRKYKDYRTRIREGMKQGPGLAGEFSVIQIGCGTECTFAYVANNKSGQVFDFPRGGEDNIDMQILTKVDSRLIIVQWGRYDSNICVVEYF